MEMENEFGKEVEKEKKFAHTLKANFKKRRRRRIIDGK